jgi:hypothetical protein
MKFKFGTIIGTSNERGSGSGQLLFALPFFLGYLLEYGGAFVGFFYGLVGAGFLLYESLPANKKVR